MTTITELGSYIAAEKAAADRRLPAASTTPLPVPAPNGADLAAQGGKPGGPRACAGLADAVNWDCGPTGPDPRLCPPLI